MTITPLTVYLIMQADSLSIGLGIFSCGGLLGCGLLKIVAEEHKISRRWLLAFLVAFAVNTFVPSTKALAAMIVVPQIANSQAIQKDFPELYQLAVGKLKEQLQPAGK